MRDGSSERIDEILEDFVNNLRFSEAMWFKEWAKVCESPIETMMAAALFWGDVYGWRPSIRTKDGDLYGEGCGSYCANVYVQPQKQLGDWRVDFFIEAPDLTIIVECDGHAYHERTADQAERDRARDRRFQELGHVVFRFTGREIYRDPSACARQVTDLIQERCGRKLYAE